MTSAPSADHHSPGDTDLMLRVRDGDHAAFEALVRRHQHAVYGTACRMLGDSVEAEDITQLTFLRIHRAAPKYQPTARFTTWMFAILRNLVFNEARRRKRHKGHVSLDAPVEFSDDATPRELAHPAQSGPDAETLQIELESQIQAALQSLPEQQRLAMVLLRYEDLSYEQIAEVLGTSVPAVKSLIFRAREMLRSRLKKYLAATDGQMEG